MAERGSGGGEVRAEEENPTGSGPSEIKSLTTKAGSRISSSERLFERGYRIEEERPIPVNGVCPFIAVREIPQSDPIGELVSQALNGTGCVVRIEVLHMDLTIRFRFDGARNYGAQNG